MTAPLNVAPGSTLISEPGATTTSGVGPEGDAGSAPGTLRFTVLGIPVPQGSHRAFVVKGRAVVTQDNKRTRPWRQDVTAAAMDARAGTPSLVGPVAVHVTFVLPRPKTHYRTGRNAHLLRDGAPMYPATKPDVDKLQRSLLDALTTAGVFSDDAQVVHIDAWKVYARPELDELPAAHVVVKAADR